jgi:hypothetical protein
MILKRLSVAMTFSQGARSLEMSRFLTLSVADNVGGLLQGCLRIRLTTNWK